MRTSGLSPDLTTWRCVRCKRVFANMYDLARHAANCRAVGGMKAWATRKQLETRAGVSTGDAKAIQIVSMGQREVWTLVSGFGPGALFEMVEGGR